MSIKRLRDQQIETSKALKKIQKDHLENMHSQARTLIKCGYSKILVGCAFGMPELIWGNKR